MESSITVNERMDDLQRHNTDYGGMIFKYDLPVTNLPITFRNQNTLALADEESDKMTGTESLLGELDCDKDTAFESFIIKMQQNYNNEVDMYGDIKQAGDSQLKVLEFGTPIPFEFLVDEH